MTSKLIDKNLVFFFTLGMSLKKWDQGGVLERELKIYNLLATKFNKIYFFSYGDKTELNYRKFLHENIQIIFKKKRINNIIYQFMIPFLFSKILKHCSFLKTNQMSASIPAVISKLLHKKKLVVRTGYTWSLSHRAQVLSNEVSGLKRMIYSVIIPIVEKISYALADKIAVSANYDKHYIENKYKIFPSRIQVIPNYVDTELFKPQNLKKKNRILFIGRLTKSKNIIELLKAVKILDIGIDIIGDGPVKKDIQDFSTKNQVDMDISGFIDHKKIPDIMNQHKVFVLPSLWEGMPKILLEAMSCGMACVGTDVKGTREVITDQENGLLCRTNAESIAKNIQKILNNKDLREKLRNNARSFIIKNYSIEKILKDEENVYLNLIR